MIYIRYKKKEWSEWAVWSCKDKEEAEKVREILRQEGYEVEGG